MKDDRAVPLTSGSNLAGNTHALVGQTATKLTVLVFLGTDAPSPMAIFRRCNGSMTVTLHKA